VTHFLGGKLLVATPKLVDPNFHRTVVLICAHDENGAFGLVLNRPLESASVERHLPGWSEYAAPPASLFLGGPVEPAMAFALTGGAAAADTANSPVCPGLAQFDLARVSAAGWDYGSPVRLFAGYAGWGAGQLDAEVEEEAWFVVDAHPADAFTPDPQGLWRAVLRRQTGRLAMFAFAPTDPSAN